MDLIFDCTSLTTLPQVVDFYSQIHGSRDRITHGEPATTNPKQWWAAARHQIASREPSYDQPELTISATRVWNGFRNWKFRLVLVLTSNEWETTKLAQKKQDGLHPLQSNQITLLSFRSVFFFEKFFFFYWKVNFEKVNYFLMFGSVMKNKLENTFQCLVMSWKMSWKITY